MVGSYQMSLRQEWRIIWFRTRYVGTVDVRVRLNGVVEVEQLVADGVKHLESDINFTAEIFRQQAE